MLVDEPLEEPTGPSPSKNRRMGSPSPVSDLNDYSNLESCQIMVDNSNNVLGVLKKLYDEKEMCDVFFKVGNKEYGAHRLILCASSDVFKVMLMRPEWTESKETKIELKEIPICETAFHTFLEYFYTGRVLITHTNVMAILALADKYMVKNLSRLCLSYMCQHVPHAASHNQLYYWLQYSMVCYHSVLFKMCENYIKWNFEAVANTPDFSNFDLETFSSILKQSDIVVHNEMVLFNCVARWLELQRVKLLQNGSEQEDVDQQYKNLIGKIVKYVRFPMMSPPELTKLLALNLVKHNKEFFMDGMSIGMKYHWGFIDEIDNFMESEEDNMLFVPRLYTSDNSSVDLTIENFWNLRGYQTCTFVFSSHVSSAEHEADKVSEWVVDLYPKGVWFKKCYLIVCQGMLEVPQEIISTVRLSLTCRELFDSDLRVKVSILIFGVRGGIEHVMEVKQKIHHFTCEDKVMHMDDLIPYHELNKPQGDLEPHDTPYMVGPKRDELKLTVIISAIR